MSSFTVLGARGRIGRRLVEHLRRRGETVFAPDRDDPGVTTRALGHVIFAIGVTGDFRTRPIDTVQAHVCVLARLLATADFESLLVLSSTRVYAGAAAGREDVPISVDVADPSDLYNLSKLMGESLCLHCGRQRVRVARLSNVVGGGDDGDTFVGTLRREARSGRIVLRSAPESAKDYVHVDDVVELLPRIARDGRERIYNVASGVQVSHREWVEALRAEAGCEVEVTPGAPVQRFPPIDIGRIRREFGFTPRRVVPAPQESFSP